MSTKAPESIATGSRYQSVIKVTSKVLHGTRGLAGTLSFFLAAAAISGIVGRGAATANHNCGTAERILLKAQPKLQPLILLNPVWLIQNTLKCVATARMQAFTSGLDGGGGGSGGSGGGGLTSSAKVAGGNDSPSRCVTSAGQWTGDPFFTFAAQYGSF
ncbi:hypothetical protein Aperf_G00000042418 [Anoplocephala perfoliata]